MFQNENLFWMKTQNFVAEITIRNLIQEAKWKKLHWQLEMWESIISTLYISSNFTSFLQVMPQNVWLSGGSQKPISGLSFAFLHVHISLNAFFFSQLWNITNLPRIELHLFSRRVESNCCGSKYNSIDVETSWGRRW